MDDRKFQKVAKALADPRRFGILQTIASCPVGKICSGEVSETVAADRGRSDHAEQ
jgi:hypothetical protein